MRPWTAYFFFHKLASLTGIYTSFQCLSRIFVEKLPIRSEMTMPSELRQRKSPHSDTSTAEGIQSNQSLSPPPTSSKIEHSLLTWDELPSWSRDNSYIKTGYGTPSNSYISSFRSCFNIHNETGNIYTHFLATLWMMVLPIFFYPYAKRHYPDANADDWIIFGLFFLGGTLCFSLSTAYHVLASHSRAVHDIFHRLDLFGISAVTAGCFPPGMWYTFPCETRSRRIFWICVCRSASVA